MRIFKHIHLMMKVFDEEKYLVNESAYSPWNAWNILFLRFLHSWKTSDRSRRDSSSSRCSSHNKTDLQICRWKYRMNWIITSCEIVVFIWQINWKEDERSIEENFLSIIDWIEQKKRRRWWWWGGFCFLDVGWSMMRSSFMSIVQWKVQLPPALNIGYRNTSFETAFERGIRWTFIAKFRWTVGKESTHGIGDESRRISTIGWWTRYSRKLY